MSMLVVGDDGGGLRHFLESRPVHAGTVLELLTDSGWQSVRYEAEWADDSLTARLLLPVGELVSPAPDVVLRWPAAGRGEVHRSRVVSGRRRCWGEGR